MRKVENNLDYKKKIKILDNAKKFVRKNGWSKNLFNSLINKDVSNSDLIYLYPNGYKDLLSFALNQVNLTLENKLIKTNIINFPISKRIKNILMTRMQILNDDIIFYKKTFNHLLLPQNSKIMKKNLYTTIDNIWYLAGDNSTDFSFYTKRITLATIYVNALFVLYNKNLQETEENIDKNLKIISKIPKLKDRFSFLKDNLPVLLRGFLN